MRFRNSLSSLIAGGSPASGDALHDGNPVLFQVAHNVLLFLVCIFSHQ